MFISIPQAQFRNDSVVLYNQPEIPYKNSIKADKMRIIQKSQYSGTVTQGAVKRIHKAIDILIQTSTIGTRKRSTWERTKTLKLVFVTLTVPENSLSLTAKELHQKCLEPFLLSMRRKQKLKSYIWKLEQQKRGALHYHITINCYISHLQIRQCWNALLDKAGLMDSYKSRFGNSNPNSTDVKAVYKCNNIAAYLAKYLSKTTQNDNAVKGKVWDCSLNLKSAKRFTIAPDSDFYKKVYDKVEKGMLKEVIGDRFRIICGKTADIFGCLSLRETRLYDIWRFEISGYKRSIKNVKKLIPDVRGVISVQKCILKQLNLSLKVSNSIALNF